MMDFVEMNKMTLYEHRIRAEAHRLSIIDKERDIHWQAWTNQCAKATKKSGKKIVSVFKNFIEFFDYEELTGEKQRKVARERQRRVEVLKLQEERGEDCGQL
jgi:hypothetical protein